MTVHPDPYVMPIAGAIAALMAIVIVSCRQTVRAYPNGGGAYIVSKENLGTIPGLVAAAALMFDYMMTVVVSIVAGVFAIGSAYPPANEHKVLLSIFFVGFITVMNLRGTKESGTLFAVPTYGFTVAILSLVAFGLVDCATGCPSVGVEAEPCTRLPRSLERWGCSRSCAFSLRATALTGVEGDLERRAGVPAAAGTERRRRSP